jgi:hypothetical protein
MSMREKVILLLPLTFNDGSVVPQETFNAIYDQLFILCDGYTVAGEVRGAYRMQTGAKQVDSSVEVWAAVAPDRIDELRRLVAGIGTMLGQETMYFERTGASVEFVAPEAPPTPPAGD